MWNRLLTRNQMDFIRHDHVTAADLLGPKELEVEPHDISEVICVIEQANK